MEDKAAQNFRDLARKQGRRTRQKHQGNFVYAMSVGLVLVLVIMGVAMLNNFNKIRKAQNQIEEVAGTINTVKDSDNSGSSNEGNDPMVDRQTVRRMVQQMKIQVQKMRTAQPVMMQIREKLTVQPIKIQIQKKATVHPIKSRRR